MPSEGRLLPLLPSRAQRLLPLLPYRAKWGRTRQDL
uniref:OSJNBb0068N06.10 protein n=1 Tax=Oryza sativa subsp. japonica TaxID=39947 RepID=Q7XNM0_ORYSJ|nr:OSJNBb0068N06.10 [Oryza sativa Japonica Group]